VTRNTFTVAFAVALTLVASTAVAQDAQAVRDVLAYQTAATDAFLRNDAVAIDTLLADDFTLTDSRGRISDRGDAAAEARARTVRYSVFRNVDQQVRLYLGGRVAVVTGRTLVAGTTADGSSFRQDLPFTDTLVLLSGRWRMVSSHVSAPPPA
jgi:ketosteroid isomerase-like protein